MTENKGQGWGRLWQEWLHWPALAAPEAKWWRYLLGIGLLGLICLLLGGLFPSRPGPASPPAGSPAAEEGKIVASAKKGEEDASRVGGERRLEKELAAFLSQIQGAGRVEVKLLLARGERREYAQNITQSEKVTTEADQAGGKREIREENREEKYLTVRDEASRREEPVPVTTLAPEVQGVVVVAGGARDPAVKAALFEAVRAVLDVPAHKIVVLPGKD